VILGTGSFFEQLKIQIKIQTQDIIQISGHRAPDAEFFFNRHIF